MRLGLYLVALTLAGQVGEVAHAATAVQTARFSSYSVDDGLSQSSVTALLQDQQGYLWIGTEDGLNRFDGYEFLQFGLASAEGPSLADGGIVSLVEGHDGRIWVGTITSGLYWLDPQSGIMTHCENSRGMSPSGPGGRIRGLSIDDSGAVWVIGTGAVFRQTADCTFETIPAVDENNGFQPVAISQSADGTMLVWTQEGELWKSLQIREQFVTGDSSDFSPMYLGLGSSLTKLGRYEEAYDTYLAGYEMNNRLFGADNSFNLFFANGLGKVAEAVGDLDTAAARYEESRRLIMKHTPDSPNLGFASANVGKVYALQGRCDLALPHYRAAEQIFSEKLASHWILGDVRSRLGRCLVELGEFAEAEQLILDGLAIVTAQWGSDHDVVANARAAAALLYEKWGRPGQAAAYREDPGATMH